MSECGKFCDRVFGFLFLYGMFFLCDRTMRAFEDFDRIKNQFLLFYLLCGRIMCLDVLLLSWNVSFQVIWKCGA